MRFRKDGMARPKGFEPLTPRFVVWCSIQLSYGRPAWVVKPVGLGRGGGAPRERPVSYPVSMDNATSLSHPPLPKAVDLVDSHPGRPWRDPAA